jgi:VanZ family protein
VLKKYIAFIPALGWSFFILIGCIVNPSQFPKMHLDWFHFSIDKIAHFFLFGIFALFINAGWVIKQKPKKWYVLGAIISAIYGLLIEQLQGSFFIYRTYEFGDMVANCIGAFSLSLIAFALDTFFRKVVAKFWFFGM